MTDIQEMTKENLYVVSNTGRGRRKMKVNPYAKSYLESSDNESDDNSPQVSENKSFLDICKLAADRRLKALDSDDDSFILDSEEEDESVVAKLTPDSRCHVKPDFIEVREGDLTVIQEECCFLCGEPLAAEVTVMTMRLHVPLPSSFLSPISLLHYFGVNFKTSGIDLGSMVTVDVCWQCHSVVLEGDKVFQNFVTVGTCMKNMWPKITNKSMLLKNVEELCNVESMDSYDEEKDEIELLPNDSISKKDAKKKRKKQSVRSCDLRMRMCELCGTSCAGLSNWEDHCESDHKVTKHWIRYTYQFALKQAILKKLKEVVSKNKVEEKVKCPACKLDFEGQNLSNHIITYHKIAIDESSLSSVPNPNEYVIDSSMVTTDGPHLSAGHMGDPGGSVIRRADAGGHEIVQSCSNVMTAGNIEYIDERVTQIGVVCNLCHIFIEGSLLEHIELSHMDIVVLLKRDQTEASRYKIDTLTSLESCDNVRSYKPKRLWKKLKFSCNICGQNKFSDLIKLLEHKRSSHEECEEAQLDYDSVLVECQFCGYRVIGTPALRLHTIEKHVQAGNQSYYEYNCKLCIFQSANKEDYKKHMEMKHGKNFNQHVQCEVCGKMVSSKYIGVHHKKMHSHSRNYACNMCDMKFFDCQSLKCHFTEEHVDNEYECELCQLKFKKYHQLRQHRIYVHSTKVYKCLYCDATFKRKCDQSSHTKRKHMEREYFYCNFCSKQFNDRGKRNKHLIMVHGVNREDTWSENFARNKRQKGYFHQRAMRGEMAKNQQGMVIDNSQKQMIMPNRQEIASTDGTLIVEQVPQFGGMGFMHPHFTMQH